ncbi:hypothetical protein [Mameliella alba]|nr:hypothetical protein [Mameliella alba]
MRAEAYPGQAAEQADRLDAERRAFMTEAASLTGPRHRNHSG